eukprot:NODE_949_length_2936_cov_0.479732.p1 type:complete len:406 gc:universal NODE_949_length_2936_cov_0.479732:1587-2804(+)
MLQTTSHFMNWISFLVIEILTLVWITGWVYASWYYRESAIIAKRGFYNILIFSIATFFCFSENLTLPFIYFDIYLSVPCYPHEYINYVFFGLFMFTYIVRGFSLLFQKHSGLIQACQVKEIELYFSKLTPFERFVIRSKTLSRKLKESKQVEEIISDHFLQTQFFKPRFLLKCSTGFIILGILVATLELLLNPIKFTEAYCTFESYLPIYAFILCFLLGSFYLSYLLRNTSDPYFLKYEFTIFMCLVVPILYIVGLTLRFLGYFDWPICILIMVLTGHLLSVVIPNAIAIKLHFLKVSHSDAMTMESIEINDLRKKAAERFCLELVMFREDYELLHQMKDVDLLIKHADEMYLAYIELGSPFEININGVLRRQAQIAYKSTKDYKVYDAINKEVKSMLYANLGVQ